MQLLLEAPFFFKEYRPKSDALYLYKAYLFLGILLAALGVGSKFLPLPLFIGCGLAYCKSLKKFFLGTFAVAFLTALQIAVANFYGCRWHELVQIGSRGSVSGAQALLSLAPLIPVLAACATLFFHYFLKGPSLPLGALAALASYALLFAAIWPHPQWYFYYGISLFASLATISLSPKWTRIMLSVLVIQGVAMAMAAQWLPKNADITMTGRPLGFEIPPLGNLYPATREFIQRIGRKALAATLVMSFAALAYNWARPQREPKTILPFSHAVWAGCALLLTWFVMVLAVAI